MPSNDPLFDDGNSEIAGRTGSRAKINSELPTIRELLGAKEGVNLFAKSVGAFEVREMSAVFQRNHACIWNCLRDVLSRTSRDEVVIAVDDQRRDLEALELGEQVILGFGPCVLHELVFDRSRFEDTLFVEACGQPAHELFVILGSRESGLEMDAVVRGDRVGIALLVSSRGRDG